MTKFKPILMNLLLASSLILTAACGSGNSNTDSNGRLSLSLVDAPSDQYKAVYVTVDSVEVHHSQNAEGEWRSILTPRKTINLLDLTSGVREALGVVSLETGHYDQIRLKLDDDADNGINILSRSHPFANYVITTENEVHELKVPSGFQSGIKIVQGFDIEANGTTELILDFDASSSVVVAGRSGQYILKPTIKVLNTVESSIVSGTVLSNGNPVVGAVVTVQVYNPDAQDEKDIVRVEAGSLTDANGNYSIFVGPGTYNLVVYKTGYNPEFATITLTPGETMDRDFTLSAAVTGSISGLLNIEGSDNDTYAHISIRQNVAVAGENLIEVRSVTVANGGAYTVILPVREYKIVSSSNSETTQSLNVDVQPDVSVPLNVNVNF